MKIHNLKRVREKYTAILLPLVLRGTLNSGLHPRNGDPAVLYLNFPWLIWSIPDRTTNFEVCLSSWGNGESSIASSIMLKMIVMMSEEIGL
jgi:hypothetical protein